MYMMIILYTEIFLAYMFMQLMHISYMNKYALYKWR